jgi:catechol 2,3-dioxygenase-like lactoylglutathione lyase family enzyme
MLRDARLIGFAATSQPEAAKRFYRDVLGLPLTEESAFALVFDANGTMLRVQKVENVREAAYTVLGWRVSDIRSKIDELSARGVHFQHYAGMAHDDRGIWKSPDGAEIAWFRDPDGNTLSLTQWPE